MSRNAPRNPPLCIHQGTMIPWSMSYNYMNSMKLVGLEGLEPSTKGFTLPRTRCLCVTKLKNPKRFPVALMSDDRNRACAEPVRGRF